MLRPHYSLPTIMAGISEESAYSDKVFDKHFAL